MAAKSFTDDIEEKLALIVPTLKAIEAGGDQPYLRELQTLLRQHVTGLLVLFERDRGLDAAMASQPLARERGLLREAQTRFQERISTARPNAGAAGAA